MVIYIAGLRVPYRKTIVLFRGRFWIEPLQSVLNMLIFKNRESILTPFIRNNLGPKVLPLPSRRTLIDYVRALFVVPIPANNLMSSLDPSSCVLQLNSKFGTRYSVAPKDE